MLRQEQVMRALTGLAVSLVMVALLTVSIAPPALLRTAYAQENSQAVGAVRVESNQPGELQLSWDAPTEAPLDYHINWARADEEFPSGSDERGNAYPATPSYLITGLDEGVSYKVRVRARYDGSEGGWSDPVEAVVAVAPTATATATATSVPADTDSYGDSYVYARRHGDSYGDSYVYARRHGDEPGYRRCAPCEQPAGDTRGVMGSANGNAARLPHQLGARGRELPILSRQLRQCLSHKPFVHDYRLGPRRALQGESARPLPLWLCR